MGSTDKTTKRPRRVPYRWVQEFAQATMPRVSDSVSPQKSVVLSYADGEENLGEKLRKRGIDLQDVSQDLSAGFWLKRHKRDTKIFYSLIGSRYRVFAHTKKADGSKEPLASITRVGTIQEPSLPGWEISLNVSCRLLRDEIRCDLEELYSEIKRQRTDRRHIERDAIRILRKAGIESETAKRRQLHADLESHFRPLRSLLSLIWQKTKIDREANARGVVEELIQRSKAPKIRSHKSQKYQPSDLIKVRVRDSSGEFKEDGAILIGRRSGGKPAKTRLREIENEVFYIIDHDRISLSPGDEVEIQIDPHDKMLAHSKSLSMLRSENVAGNWRNLATLLCRPTDLRVETLRFPESYFSEGDGSAMVLNEGQKKAIAGALSTPHCYFVQGPPGTGKTTVITEIIQQLAASGERVLLLAPTHVAVDEVLRRLEHAPDVFPVRISRDDAKVSEDVRDYVRSKVKKKLVDRVRTPSTSRVEPWKREADKFSEEYGSLTKAVECGARCKRLADEILAAEEEHWRSTEKARSELRDMSDSIRRKTSDREEKQQRRRVVAKKLDRVSAEAASAADQTTGVRRLFSSTLGRIAKLRRQQSALEAEQRQIESTIFSLTSDVLTLERTRSSRTHDLADVDLFHGATIESATSSLGQTKADFEQRLRSMDLRPDTSLSELERLRDRPRVRMQKLGQYIELERLWFELNEMTHDVDTTKSIADKIGDDLLMSVNLVCCTTVGVAGDKFVRETHFDTLIVDEASRVTDAEFLIGAVRSRRWILVGDEHQLPPYVEQENEHHLHALAALRSAEPDLSPDSIADSVKRLAAIWEEDEEHHAFRKKAVEARAHELLASKHRNPASARDLSEIYRYSEDGSEEPEKVVLRAMRRFLVQSLFEKAITQVDDSVKNRLNEQRRMIRPIAELVRDTVYEGDFYSPSDEELAACGVAPLTKGRLTHPIMFMDTSLKRAAAEETPVGNGFWNSLECKWIVSLCKNLERELAESSSISILSFYRAQSLEIRRRLGSPHFRNFTHLRFEVIDAIDKIQGQESDIVILSFCRTHRGKRIRRQFGQWLQDLRRLNVACTRAHRALVLVGHRRTLEGLSYSDKAVRFYNHLFKLLDSDPNMTVVSDYRE